MTNGDVEDNMSKCRTICLWPRIGMLNRWLDEWLNGFLDEEIQQSLDYRLLYSADDGNGGSSDNSDWASL